jgi:hypothetical protein
MTAQMLAQKHTEALQRARRGEDPEAIAEAVGWSVRAVQALVQSVTFAGQATEDHSST